MTSGVIISLPTYSLSYDAYFQDLTETHIEWLPIVRFVVYEVRRIFFNKWTPKHLWAMHTQEENNGNLW